MGVFFMGSELQTMNGQNKLALWANVINLRIPFQSVKKEDKILVKVLIDK